MRERGYAESIQHYELAQLWESARIAALILGWNLPVFTTGGWFIISCGDVSLWLGYGSILFQFRILPSRLADFLSGIHSINSIPLMFI
jgi:hypothetical protein